SPIAISPLGRQVRLIDRMGGGLSGHAANADTQNPHRPQQTSPPTASVCSPLWTKTTDSTYLFATAAVTRLKAEFIAFASSSLAPSGTIKLSWIGRTTIPFFTDISDMTKRHISESRCCRRRPMPLWKYER